MKLLILLFIATSIFAQNTSIRRVEFEDSVGVHRLRYDSTYTGVYSLRAFAGANDSIKLVAALSALSAEATVYLPPRAYTFGTQTIDFDLTIPRGAVINGTLTITGNINAGRYQIFTAGASITMTGEAYPEWWYAGEYSYKTALNAAIQDSLTLLFSKGIYLVDSVEIDDKDYVSLIGDGTIFKMPDARGVSDSASRSITLFENCDYLVIRGIEYDANRVNGYVDQRKCLRILHSKHAIIEQNKFLNTLLSTDEWGAGAPPWTAGEGLILYDVDSSFIQDNYVDGTDVAIDLRGCDDTYLGRNYIDDFRASDGIVFWVKLTDTTEINTNIILDNNTDLKNMNLSYGQDITIIGGVYNKVHIGGTGLALDNILQIKRLNWTGGIVRGTVYIGGKPTYAKDTTYAFDISLKGITFTNQSDYAYLIWLNFFDGVVISDCHFVPRNSCTALINSSLSVAKMNNDYLGSLVVQNNTLDASRTDSVTYGIKGRGHPFIIDGNKFIGKNSYVTRAMEIENAGDSLNYVSVINNHFGKIDTALSGYSGVSGDRNILKFVNGASGRIGRAENNYKDSSTSNPPVINTWTKGADNTDSLLTINGTAYYDDRLFTVGAGGDRVETISPHRDNVILTLRFQQTTVIVDNGSSGTLGNIRTGGAGDVTVANREIVQLWYNNGIYYLIGNY